MKKVLSFDVGIINLAYCLLEINNDSFEIKKWGIIDLADNRKHCCYQKNSIACGKIAKTKTILSPNSNIQYRCKAHENKITIDTRLCDNIKFIESTNQNECKQKCNHCVKNGIFTSKDIDGYFCHSHKSKPLTCTTKKCKNIIDNGLFVNDKLIVGWCDEHFLTDCSEYVKTKTKKMSQNSNKTALDYLGVSMYKKLDELDILNVDEVLVENQPTFINPTMKTVSAMLYSYFIMRGIYEKDKTNSTIQNIRFCSPSNKIKVGGKEANDKLENAKVNKDERVYKVTKELGKKLCKALIDDKTEWIEFMSSHKKQDDLADSFLQGFIMSYGQNIPIQYVDKINKLNISENNKSVKSKKSIEKSNDEKIEKSTRKKIVKKE